MRASRPYPCRAATSAILRRLIGRIDRPPALTGSVTLADLEATLTANRLTCSRFNPVDGRPGIYQLSFPGDEQVRVSFCYAASPSRPSDYGLNGATRTVLVTFRREIAVTGQEELTLLTFGSPHLAVLLPSPESGS